MTIVQYIGSIVAQMSNHPKFLHGTKAWQNLLADEIDYTNGAVFMDDTLQAPLNIEKSGYITETYPILIAFFKKGNIDDTPDQQQAIISAMQSLCREFITRLFNDSDNVKNFKGIKISYLINMMDANLHGISLNITFDYYNNASICT